MPQHILPAEIGNDGKQGRGVHDVKKILIRSHSKIDPTALHPPVQIVDDMEIRRFVRYEVVGIKVAFRLRPFIDVLPELLYRYLKVSGSARLFRAPRDGRNNEYGHQPGDKNRISAELKKARHAACVLPCHYTS